MNNFNDWEGEALPKDDLVPLKFRVSEEENGAFRDLAGRIYQEKTGKRSEHGSIQDGGREAVRLWLHAHGKLPEGVRPPDPDETAVLLAYRDNEWVRKAIDAIMDGYRSSRKVGAKPGRH